LGRALGFKRFRIAVIPGTACDAVSIGSPLTLGAILNEDPFALDSYGFLSTAVYFCFSRMGPFKLAFAVGTHILFISANLLRIRRH